MYRGAKWPLPQFLSSTFSTPIGRKLRRPESQMERKAKRGQHSAAEDAPSSQSVSSAPRILKRTWIVIKFHHVHHRPINQRKKFKSEEGREEEREGSKRDEAGLGGGGGRRA